MGLKAGETVPLRTLLEGVAIASANDAATAVSEHIGGTEEAFVVRMNAKAQALGLRSTHFANAHGLPDPAAAQHGGGSRASSRAGCSRINPPSRPLLGGANFVYRGRVYARRIPLFQDPGGVQALKTGFTREAGYNLAVSAWRAGERFLLIVLGAQTRSLSFRDARALLAVRIPRDGHRDGAGAEAPGARADAAPVRAPLARPRRRPAPRRLIRADAPGAASERGHTELVRRSIAPTGRAPRSRHGAGDAAEGVEGEWPFGVEIFATGDVLKAPGRVRTIRPGSGNPTSCRASSS